MNRVLAIALREYASMFRIPAGWVIIALFLALSSIFFVSSLSPGSPATMGPFLGVWWSMLLILMPAVSMRAFSEELRSGTLDTVLTSPTPPVAIVVGKYLSCALFYLTMLAPTLIYVGILFLNASPAPDIGPILCGYCGILLLGLLYLAVGVLASSITANQTLAFMGTLFSLLILDVFTQMAPQFAPELLDNTFGSVVAGLSANARIKDFAQGMLHTKHLVYFASAIALLLTLTTVTLQSRRWR